MAAPMTEEEFLILVAERIQDTQDDHTYADADLDRVDGALSTVLQAALDVLAEHGPVVFGD